MMQPWDGVHISHKTSIPHGDFTWYVGKNRVQTKKLSIHGVVPRTMSAFLGRIEADWINFFLAQTSSRYAAKSGLQHNKN